MPPPARAVPDARATTWSTLDDTVRALADHDAAAGGPIRPRLLGFRGELALAVVELRPFPPGGVPAPAREAVAALLALGADRLATALPSRAWSLDDPVPPVTDDVDLRQRVVTVLTAARRGTEPPAVTTRLLPHEPIAGGRLRWSDAQTMAGAADGVLPRLLAQGVAAVELVADADEGTRARLLARCVAAGGTVLLSPTVAPQSAGR